MPSKELSYCMLHLHEAGGAGGQMAMGMIYHSTAAIKQAIVHINGDIMTEAKNVVCTRRCHDSRLQKGRFQITVEPSLCMALGSCETS